jgi:sulfite exporter TauE/SafE
METLTKILLKSRKYVPVEFPVANGTLPCLSLVYIAVIKTMTKGNLRMKGFIWLMFPNYSSSLRESKTETQAGRTMVA